MRYYGLDLRAEAERAGLRRLWVLVKGLPADSALHRDEQPRWTIEHELLARNAELTSAWGRIVAMALGAKSQKLPKAHEVEHPDRAAPKPELTTDPQAIYDFFKGRR